MIPGNSVEKTKLFRGGVIGWLFLPVKSYVAAVLTIQVDRL